MVCRAFADRVLVVLEGTFRWGELMLAGGCNNIVIEHRIIEHRIIGDQLVHKPIKPKTSLKKYLIWSRTRRNRFSDRMAS